MKTINDFVDAMLNVDACEKEFISELCSILKISENHIKSIKMNNYATTSNVTQAITIELIGKNRFRSEDIAKIEGLSIVTPNTLEISVGEIDL